MSPPSKRASGSAPLVPHANDQDEVREALRDAETKERLRALTPEELAHWAETGEWPESHG